MAGMLDLKGQVALITGAAGGFGSAIALALSGAGARVVVVGRSRDKLEGLAAELEGPAMVISGDLSRPAEAERITQAVVAKLGRLDILVNNAGGATVGGIMSLSDEQWQADLDLKLLGYLRMMRAAAKVMQGQDGGKIINVVGLAGHEPYHLLTAPSVVNAAILALTKTAADELAPANIRVNAVNPNAALTGLGDEMIEKLAAAQGTGSAEVRNYLLGATPLGRLVRAEDVAKVVLFYASELSSFLTGSSLDLDGGAHRAIA
ncbi:MAG TPA: SDR family oxidoreductase [Chloroflexia bacterium]|nr:SDR family oxidoreductase [Chloroflexia bacterium]